MTPYTRDEIMTVTAARQLRNGAVCFVGIGLPSAACNLARLTHAPDLMLIYESGTLGTRPVVLPLSIGDGELAETAICIVPLPEIFAHYLQRGRVDVGFLGAAHPDKNFVGNLFGLLNPYALLGGVVAIVMFALHGAVFLSLRTAGDLQELVRRVARRLWFPGAIVMLFFAIWGRFETDLFASFGVVPGTLPFVTAIAFIAAYVFMRLKNDGWAFVFTGFTIVLATVVAFQGLYPRVMPSSLDHKYDLTIYNASSSNLTLTIMLVVALCFVPIVLVYQGWTYWVFRKRVTRESIEGSKAH
jgi:hypothetical protein